MGAIVDDDMDKIGGGCRAHHGQGTHMHQNGPITINTPDFCVRLLNSNAKRYRRAVPHGTNGQKIVLMPLPVGNTSFKQFPAGLARRGHNRIRSADSNHMFYCLFPEKMAGILIFHHFIKSKCPFSDNKSSRFPFLKKVPECLHGFFYLFRRGIFPYHKRCYVHVLQKL